MSEEGFNEEEIFETEEEKVEVDLDEVIEEIDEAVEEIKEVSEELEEQTEEIKEQIEEVVEIEEVEEEEHPVKESAPWIFFDYSGTLVDTVKALSRAYTRFLGKEFPQDRVKNLYKDYPKMHNLTIMRKYKINPFKYLAGGKDKLEEIRKEEFMTGVRAFPGIQEVLLRLQKMSIAKLAILTHETELEDEEERERILQHFAIPNVFETVITDVKNKEEAFKLFIQENPVSFGIIISDMQFDLDIGKKNNLKTIGVTWGFSSQEELDADHVIGDPRELLQVIVNLMHQREI
ncbi:MAG: HAD family hydrolase [Candidatus Heimdallarchaeota archaeon]